MIDFRAAMQSAGLEPPEHIEPDRFHRFPGIGKQNGNTAGWCKLFSDGMGGIFGDFSTGLSESWQAEREQPITQAEREAFCRQVEASRRQADEQRSQEQQQSAVKARQILAGATEDLADHPYAMTKNVSFGNLVKRGPWPQRGWTDALLVPLFDESAEVVSLQAINANGDKDFLAGGKKKGCFHPHGKFRETTGRVLIGEGLATVSAAVSATGLPGVMAIDAGNLLPVAEVVRRLAPDAVIVVLADDDRKPDTDHNPGIKAATDTALAVNGLLAVPDMNRKGDFWDLLNERGPDAVRVAIEAAAPVADQKDGKLAARIAAAPLPLPDLPAVEPFDFNLLPEKIAPWVEDIAERLQCPPDYVAAGVMVNLATVIGRKIGIRPQERTDWTVVANLWALIVGRPGVMKSPALEATSGPLDRLIVGALEIYDQAKKEVLAAKAAGKLRFEAQEKEARRQLKEDPDKDISNLLTIDDIEEPTLRRYKTNDTTAASLGELLRVNYNGLLVYRDEMVSLLKGLDREDNAGERGFYLTAWNGDSDYTLDRIGRGLHLHIEACCISLLGSTQPGRLSGYINQAVRGGCGDDGLIQRFSLMIWPDVKTGWQNIDRPPDTTAKNAAYEVFERLDKLNPIDIGAEQDVGFDGTPEGIPFLRFTTEALALFNEWRANLERRLRSGELHQALESHFSKYRKLVPALALIIHLTDDGVGPVTEVATLKALAWADYLESHARRCYGSATEDEVQAAKAIMTRIRKGDLKSPFSSRDVWRPGWTGLDREAARKGLAMLLDYGHLTTETIKTAGRPATLYHAVEVQG